MWNPYVPLQRHWKCPPFIREKNGGMNFEMQYYVTYTGDEQNNGNTEKPRNRICVG
jgi:hypothetical protein